MADLLVPLLMTLTCATVMGGTDVFSAFTEGAERGLRTVFGMVKALIPLLALVGMARAAGVFTLLASLFAPLTDGIGLSGDVLTVFFLRPFSGSAALAAAEDVVAHHGADSLAGRVAVTALAAGETTLYVTGLYLGGKKNPYAGRVLFASLAGDAAVALAAIAWNLIFFSEYVRLSMM